MIYTIDGTDHIIGHVSAEDAAVVSNAEQFTSEAELSELAAGWPAARLVDIWDSLPGAAAVKKFKDRATGASRIWKAIQPAEENGTAEQATEFKVESATSQEAEQLDALAEPEATLEQQQADVHEAEQGPTVAPETAPATDKPTRPKKSHKVARNANGARDGSKTAAVLALLKREGGVTAQELMDATGWQPHSVRGFLSGTLRKKMGIDVLSAKREGGRRFYSIA